MAAKSNSLAVFMRQIGDLLKTRQKVPLPKLNNIGALFPVNVSLTQVVEPTAHYLISQQAYRTQRKQQPNIYFNVGHKKGNNNKLWPLKEVVLVLKRTTASTTNKKTKPKNYLTNLKQRFLSKGKIIMKSFLQTVVLLAILALIVPGIASADPNRNPNNGTDKQYNNDGPGKKFNNQGKDWNRDQGKALGNNQGNNWNNNHGKKWASHHGKKWNNNQVNKWGSHHGKKWNNNHDKKWGSHQEKKWDNNYGKKWDKKWKNDRKISRNHR
jgi:hypothetical protein